MFAKKCLLSWMVAFWFCTIIAGLVVVVVRLNYFVYSVKQLFYKRQQQQQPNARKAASLVCFNTTTRKKSI